MRRVVLGCAGAALAIVASLSVSGEALAGSFAEDGTFEPDPDAIATLDFEGELPTGVDAAIEEDESALIGTHVMSLSPFSGVDLDVAVLDSATKYRVTTWFKGGEVVSNVEIYYSDRVDEVTALYPTGRMTSDGWVEMSNVVRVDGARVTRATVGFFAPSGGVVDAVEVVPVGPLSTLEMSGQSCEGAGDPVCGLGQVCRWSQCENATGWVPELPENHAELAEYLAARIELLFGPFIERTVDLPYARIAIEQMRQANDPWTFWSGFTLAVRLLHDGHTTTSGLADFVLQNPRPINTCFIEGNADATHATEPADPDYLDVLVSHRGAEQNLGLNPGDRLVRVDGQHPIAWARKLVSVHWSMPAISNHETYAELASSMRAFISRYAHEIEVIRCVPSMDGLSAECGEVEKIVIADMPPLAPDAEVEFVACDNRPLRHLADSPSTHSADEFGKVYYGLLNESDPTEAIYGAEWESLFTTTGNDGVGPDLRDAVEAFQASANGVILDHRRGTGGTIRGPEIVWDWVVPEHASNFYFDRQRAEDEQPTLAEGIELWDQALALGVVDYAGSGDPQTDIPVALLITEDVSASDWLPLGMKGQDHIRIFGPYETNGAFSTRYSFGYWLGVNYVMATGDTLVPDGRTLNGTGIEPDVVSLPGQTDLVLGKDTVFEAALAWVRQEMQP